MTSGGIEVIWLILGAYALLAICIATDAWKRKSVPLALVSVFTAWFGFVIYCREVAL